MYISVFPRLSEKLASNAFKDGLGCNISPKYVSNSNTIHLLVARKKHDETNCNDISHKDEVRYSNTMLIILTKAYIHKNPRVVLSTASSLLVIIEVRDPHRQIVIFER